MQHELDSPPEGVGGPSGGSGAGGNEGGGAGAQPPKRTRVLLSCGPCRVSKLKCDRAVPCSNCLKKGRADVCAYAPRPKKPAKPATGMAARLRRLEGMLRVMMDDEQQQQHLGGGGGGTSSPTARQREDGTAGGEGAFAGTAVSTDYDEGILGSSSSAARAAAASAAAAAGDDDIETTGTAGEGRVVRGARATTYVGATHFMAMLDDIEDLKSYFDWPSAEDEGGEDDPDPADPLSSSSAQLSETAPDVYDTPENVILQVRSIRSKDDLLAILPQRSVVDRLTMRYFSSNTPTQHTIHRPTFAKHYGAFWQDPAKADMEWFALLFGIMAMGVHFSTFAAPHELQLDSSHMTATQRFKLYLTVASRAMAASKFTRPSIRTVQGMLVFVEAEFLLNRASQTNCWLLSGVTVRLMLNMGMHRDPSKLPNISAFEGEIRRRMWNLAIQLDLISSFHMGLPSMIHGIPSDTTLAHNLTDEDFGEDTAVLPPGRPPTEYTNMSYPIFKSTVCRVFGRVARLSHTLTPPSYAEVLRTDTLLVDTWRRIPAFMKMKPLGDSIADPPVQVIQRFGLASLYQKSRCVLHRRYLAEAVPRAEHLYSRRTCLQAALDLLEYHEAIYDATQPGGLLHSMGWFITALGMHDFLLAAMIVYIVVQNEAQFEGELIVDSLAGVSTGGSGGTGAGQRDSFECDPGTTRTAATGTSGYTGYTGSTSNGSTSTGSHGSPPQPEERPFGGLAKALPVERGALVDLLRRACRIWDEVAKKTPEVKKARFLLDAMLEKIDRNAQERSQPQQEQQQQQQQQQSVGPYTTQGSGIGTAASTTGTDFSGTTDSAGGGVFVRTAEGPPYTNLTMADVVPTTGLTPGDLAGQPAADPDDVQVFFSRREMVPTLPAAPTNTDGALDNWFPMTLDTLDWETVDDGLRNSNNQPSEWMDSSHLDNINYLGSGLWDYPDGALQ